MKKLLAIFLAILLSCPYWIQAQTSYPPIYSALCTNPYKIVVVGSSTAYGSGATPIDSSWARKFAVYIGLQNSQSTLVNLGQPGFTSYHVMPTGYIPPPTRPFPVDVTHNITYALSLKPDAIIVNLPSNDIALGIPVAEVKANFDLIVAKADSAKVPVWVTTTQPRNTLSPAEKLMQVELRDWILQHYGNKAIDFWTDIANPDYTIATFYSANDGVHVNNAGHDLFFRRVVEEKIWDSICLRRNGNTNVRPVAVAGEDRLIHLPPNTTTLNGSGSFDSDGTIVAWKWRKVTGPAMVFSNDAIANPSANSLTYGTYSFELMVTDDKGATDKDTMVLTVNNPPVANAGADKLIHLPPDTTTLNGSASFDSDGSITAYKWKKITGPAMAFSNDGVANPLVNSLTYGIYSFELMVTDNRGGTAKDTMVLTVNNPPVANAGTNVTIVLPDNLVTLSAAASTDADGSITSYNWKQISGAAVPIASPSLVQTILTFSAAGTYQFELTVTDNRGVSAKDSVDITVNPAVVTSALQSSIVSAPLLVYPNPGTGNIFLEIPDEIKGKYNLDLVNLTGQTVLQKTGMKYNTSLTDKINISNLPKGVYMLKVWSKNKNASTTIFKL